MLVKNTIFTKTKTYPIYFKTPEFVYQLARYNVLSSTAKRVYGVIYSRIMQSEESVFKNRDMRFWDYSKEKVLCYFTEKDIAGRLGISTSSVSNAKKALKKSRLIECEDVREGFKCITKFYLTDLNTLGIPAHLLYYGTAGGKKVDPSKVKDKSALNVYATFQKTPAFMGKNKSYRKYTKVGWDIYTYIFNRILDAEMSLAKTGTSAFVDKDGKCFFECVKKGDLAHQLGLDTKSVKTYIDALISDQLISLEAVNHRFRYYLCDLDNIGLDNNSIYQGYLGGCYSCAKIGKNEDGASIIPDSVKTNNNRISSDLHDATPNNKKPANANNTNVSSSQNTKSGKIAHKSNQLNQVNYLLDIEKIQNPFLKQIVNRLLDSKVHLTYLRIKKATQNQINVIKNQLSSLQELISQVSKSFVESKVQFIINNDPVRTDALNYLLATIKKEIHRRQTNKEITANKQHTWNKAQQYRRNNHKHFATEIDKKMYEAGSLEEQQKVWKEYQSGLVEKQKEDKPNVDIEELKRFFANLDKGLNY